MSEEMNHQRGIESDENDADDFVVIQEGSDSEKYSTTSDTTLPTQQPNSDDLQSTAGSLATVADIGNGLDGNKMVASTISQQASLNESYSGALFSTSLFSAFDMDNQIRELVRSENEQNRLTLDQIKNTLGELAKEKSNNNELSELISIHKQSLEKAMHKIAIMENSNEEKDQKISQLEETIRQLFMEKNELEKQVAKSEEEVATKDEIINVLREETSEQQKIHDTRVKVWRERLDNLEEMLASYRDRGEVVEESELKNSKKPSNVSKNQSDPPLFFICEKCLNAFPKYGYLCAHNGSGCE